MSALELMRARLKYRGGTSQQDRMIKDKRETLDRVVLYSYQGAKVQKVDSDTVDLALINPNQVKQDYDDKIISIGYECGYTPGPIFEWVNTDTKWLIYLQDLTELAYFKGDIRKCSYEIKWKDEQACCLVLASSGYPGKYEKGKVITGLDNVDSDIVVFHAGTSHKEVDGCENIVTSGGRVLNVCAMGNTLEEVREKVYKAAQKIDFEGKYFRKDIGLAQE